MQNLPRRHGGTEKGKGLLPQIYADERKLGTLPEMPKLPKIAESENQIPLCDLCDLCG